MNAGRSLFGTGCFLALAAAVACGAEPAVTVAMPVVQARDAGRAGYEDDIDLMVEIVPSSASAEPGSAASGGSAATMRLVQGASTPTVQPVATAPAASPSPASTPKPAPTVVAPTATPAPPTIAGCPFSQVLSEDDGTVRAAQAPPAVFYGGGLCAGDRVEASITGKACGGSTVDGVGQWSITIRPNASCGPTEGALVTLTVNGKAATVSPPVVWKGGGLPPNVTSGYTLTR